MSVIWVALIKGEKGSFPMSFGSGFFADLMVEM
jgi:hypothetical protein